MLSILQNIGSIAFLLSFVLLIHTFISKAGKIKRKRYAIYTFASFGLLAFAISIEDGVNGFFSFLGVMSLITIIILIGFIIQALKHKTGKALYFGKLLIIPFIVMFIGFIFSDSPSEATLQQGGDQIESEPQDNGNNEEELSAAELKKAEEQALREQEATEKQAQLEKEKEAKVAADLKKKEETEKADREKAEAEAKIAAKEAEEREAKALAGELGQLKVHYINVGQADATLLEATANDGKKTSILIDTGDWNKTDALDYLRSVGVTDIDVVVGTHPHADHIGQMDKVLHAFNVNEVWMSGDPSSSQVFQRALQAIDDTNANYLEPRTGDSFQIGDLAIDIVSPSSVNGNANDGSISMRIVYGAVSFMFTGDAETKAEQAMVSSGQNLKADILHLGHHGSDTSTTQAFFEKVSPKTAIYSAGKNGYGHPSPSVVDRVKSAKVDLYGTDVHGTIVLTTDGKTYDIATNQKGTVTTSATTQKPVAQAKPQAESKPATEATPSEPVANSSCVDINTANRDQLQAIIHIGPARADLVIEARPFNSVNDLTRVKGIAAGRLADIVAEGKACAR